MQRPVWVEREACDDDALELLVGDGGGDMMCDAAPADPAPAPATAPNLPPLNVGQDFAGGAHVNGLQHSGGFTFHT